MENKQHLPTRNRVRFGMLTGFGASDDGCTVSALNISNGSL